MGEQRTRRRPTSHPVPKWRGPGPPLRPCLPFLWVAAAKVGLEDAAQLKLRGLGEDYGQKRTRTILPLCRMTLPCSMLTLPIGAVPHDAGISYLMQPRAAPVPSQRSPTVRTLEELQQSCQYLPGAHISMSRSGSCRTEKDKVLQQFATHLAWFVSFQIDFSPTLAAALITGGNMSAIHDAVLIPQIHGHKMLTLAFAFTRHQRRPLGHVCATNKKELGCTGSVPSTARPASSARWWACASYAAHSMPHATGSRTCVSYQAPDPMPIPRVPQPPPRCIRQLLWLPASWLGATSTASQKNGGSAARGFTGGPAGKEV